MAHFSGLKQKTIREPKACSVCNRKFTPTCHWNHLCSDLCRKAHYILPEYYTYLRVITVTEEDRLRQQRLDEEKAAADALAAEEKAKVDDALAAQRREWAMKGVRNRKGYRERPKISGTCVYLWLDKTTKEVIYVGKGLRNRAWQPHTHNAACEHARERLGTRFTVEIVADNLTNEGAMLLEGNLIRTLKTLGHPLTNKNRGMQRAAVSPLTISEELVPV